jgi:tetratricopeptide (TPR) repeat protein
MKTTGPFVLMLAALLALPTGCRPEDQSHRISLHSNKRSTDPNSTRAFPAPDSCALVLSPHRGQGKLDAEIRQLQSDLPAARQPELLLERLGWLYVAKARSSFDPGFYKLAEQCALCLAAKAPDSADALLLRGHALQSLHRFRQAEPLARKLVAERGLPFDHGLLGDVLMEQGRLAEAIDEYQIMVDTKPDAQAYARIAHVRWLKGDLAGALAVMQMAAAAASPQAAESASWFYTRLGAIHLLGGDLRSARTAGETALSLQPDYPPALLLLGRARLAAGQTNEAAEFLRLACRLNPLPEFQWTLIEALEASGQTNEAHQVKVELLRTGTGNDPRTFSLFLASYRQQPERAVELAELELAERADVHTHDALAWSLAAAGRWEEALPHSRQAVSEGTADPRLHLHAGLIAMHLDDMSQARAALALAAKYRHSLLPSEQRRLEAALASQRLFGEPAPRSRPTGGQIASPP